MLSHLRPTLRLALPIIAAQLAMMGTRVADTVMAGRLGEADLAAVSAGVAIFMVLALLLFGFAQGVSATVSQLVGADRPPAQVGQYVQQVLWLAAAAGAVLGLGACALGLGLIPKLGLSDLASSRALGYVLISALGTPVLAVSLTLRFAADGVGDPRPYLWIAIGGLVLNVLLNWVFMWGKLGAPAMGATGAALATVISDVARTAAMLLAYRWRHTLAPLRLLAQRAWPSRTTAAEWWRVGAPIAITLAFEGGLFGTMTLLMARFGDSAAAAHQIAINFASICFMVPLGVAFAATVRVGHAVGRGDAGGARQAASAAVLLAVIFSAVSAAIMVVWPSAITALYTGDGLARGAAVLATQLLAFAAAFQLVDCVQASAAGALRGYKDVLVPMALTLVAYWLVGLPVGLVLAFWPPAWAPAVLHGPAGLWCGLIAGLGVAAVLLSARLRWRAGVGAAATEPHHA